MKTKTKKLLVALLATTCLACAFAACGDSGNNNSVNNNSSIVVPDTSLKISQTSLSLRLNESATLTLTNAGETVLWSVGDATVAKVENGVVTALSFGTTEVIARTETGTVKCTVEVSAQYQDRYGLQFNANSIKLTEGNAYELFATVMYGAEKVNYDTIEWTCDNPEIATVSETGVVTAVALGKTKVSAIAKVGETILHQECVVTVVETVDIVLNNENLLFTTEMSDLKLDVSCSKLVGESMVEVPVTDLTFEPLETGLTFNNDGSFTIEKGGYIDVAVRYGDSAERVFTLEVYDNLIRTEEEFLAINNDLSGMYMLMDDIDFATTSFTGISTFDGVLNGNGFSVKNISRTSDGPGGVFVFAGLTGTIKNIAFENLSFAPWSGIMLGSSSFIGKFSGNLENVYVDTSMTGPVMGVMPWADYRPWNLKTGGLIQAASGGYVRNVILDVAVSDGSDVSSVMGAGETEVENLFVYSSDEMMPTNHNGKFYVTAGDFMIGEETEVLPLAQKAFENSNVWNVTEETVAMNAGVDYMPTGTFTVKIMVGTTVIWETTVNALDKIQNPGSQIGDYLVVDYDFDFNKRITKDTIIQATVFDTNQIIDSKEDLLAIDGKDGYYVLGCDIDFENETRNVFISSFSGILEGNGYSIKNVNISTDFANTHSFFGTLSGTVQHIGFENFTLGGKGCMTGTTGLIVKYLNGGTLDNVYVQGTMYGTSAYVTDWCDYTTWGLRSGLLVGEANGATIKDVIIDVETEAGNDFDLVAGKGSYAYGSIFIYQNANLTGWMNTMGSRVYPDAWAGYVSGVNETMKTIFTGATFGNAEFWNVTDTTIELKENCVMDLGILDTRPDATVTVEVYKDGSVVDSTEKTGKVGDTFNVTNEANANVPTGYVLDEENSVLKGTLTEGGLTLKIVYKKDVWNVVTTKEQFLAMNGSSDKFILMGDIDFEGAEYTDNVIASFSGILEGNGYTVKNAVLNATNVNQIGIFGNLSGTIQHIGFENITANGFGGNKVFGTAGLLVNTLSGMVAHVSLQGTMNGIVADETYASWGLDAGQIVGQANGGTIMHVIADVNCTSANSGINIMVGKGNLTHGVVCVVPVTGSGVEANWQGNTALTALNPSTLQWNGDFKGIGMDVMFQDWCGVASTQYWDVSGVASGNYATLKKGCVRAA